MIISLSKPLDFLLDFFLDLKILETVISSDDLEFGAEEVFYTSLLFDELTKLIYLDFLIQMFKILINYLLTREDLFFSYCRNNFEYFMFTDYEHECYR